MWTTPSAWWRSALAGLMLVLLLPVAATAQFRAAVQGTVRTAKGEPLAQVTVIVINNETHGTDQTVTSKQGVYFVSGLPPGVYTVTVQRDGFKTRVATQVAVQAETPRLLNFVLEAGDIAERVIAAADPQVLQTESGNVGGTISEVQVRQLPQVGRDPYELIRLAPGMFGSSARSADGAALSFPNAVGPGGSSLSIFQAENQVQAVAFGQRVSANSFSIDGVGVNSLRYGGAEVTPNQESVKEITVVASSYSAEDGRSSGALIKMVSQAGTNALHGSGLFKYSDPGLNSANKYGGPNDTAPRKVEQRFRQYAGSLGGPIFRDMLFFFGSFEHLRGNMSQVASATVETPELRGLVQRQHPGGVTASILGAPGIEPRIRTLLPIDCGVAPASRCQVLPGGLDVGSPTGTLGSAVELGEGVLDGIPDVQFAEVDVPHLVRGTQYHARFDSHRGRDRFAISSYFTRRHDRRSDGLSAARPMFDSVFAPVDSVVTAVHSRALSSTLLNEARVNFTGVTVDDVRSSKDTDFGIPPASVNSIGGSIRFGRGHWDNLYVPGWDTAPAVLSQRALELRDIVTTLLGRHSLKFGGEIRWERDHSNTAVRPSYLFASLFDFANDAPFSGSIQLDARTGLPANLERHFRTSSYGLFVQDDWKLRPNLTLNLGLRYDYFAPLTERDGLLTNLELGPTGRGDSKLVPGSPFHDPDRNNFAPRVGAAWSPQRFGDRLVVRGGFGISYNRIPLGLMTNAQTNPPYSVRSAYCCAPIPYLRGSSPSPFSFAHSMPPFDPGAERSAVYYGNLWGAPSDFPNPYVYRYSLEGQYQLSERLVASAGYLGNTSRKLIRIVEYWYPLINDSTVERAFFLTPDGRSQYNAMELRLTRQYADGFGVGASYRLSRSVDTAANEFASEISSAPLRNLFPPKSSEEPADSDARHSFVLAGVWNLPFLAGRSDALGRIGGGWHMSGILTAHSGFPWTPVIETEQGFRLPTRQLGQTYFVTEEGQPVLGRNFLRGPRYFSVDMTVGKMTSVVGRTNLDVRANVFNLFNTLNLAPFTTSSAGILVNNATFGRADGALAGRVVELQIRFSF